MTNSISIRWLGHAAYKVSKGESHIVLDPFAPGSVPGFRDIAETAGLVLCSHGHHDHSYADAVALLPQGAPDFTVTTLGTYHDNEQGAKRGPNTVHVLESDGVRIVHFGDLGCALTEEQIETLKGADVVLIPVGGFYTIDAAGAKAVLDAIKPKIAIPMHYRTERFGLPAIGTLDEFLALCENVTKLNKDTFVVGEVESGVVVLEY
ncbi:MAG: MBL fold metallo-hydrolase [Clostridia bacterium]|nr:MBL fold metallo-hydrolase [Clostridia bacterium]